MLTWTQRHDGWYADDYVIRFIEPFRWELARPDEGDTQSSVTIVTQPLATTRTLSACKREAELITEAAQREGTQRRKLGQIAIATCGLVMIGNVQSVTSLLMALTMIVVILRSIGALIETTASRFNLGSAEVFYQ